MTLIEARNLYRVSLSTRYTEGEIDYYFKSILATVLQIEPLSIALQPHLELEAKKKERLKQILEALIQEKPLQYILGQIPFRKLVLKVNPLVLIPRPETEELVDWVIADYLDIHSEVVAIDMGTGSGCIALSLKKEQPLFQVHVLDLQQDILGLVQENANLNEVEVNCIAWDMTQLEKLQFKVDLIISNPPYITPQEKTAMKKNVLDYEPHQALFVPQENPLLYYRHILEYAQKNLKSKGKLYFEINPLFESELETLISSFEYYSLTKREDLFGKVRMFRLEKE
ncbi:MAG: peptide chain release factor N(5)-glutamine methyltransferase [Flavobacteriaceae bacterium]|jgi:release factor glutamine methyltransferase